MSRSDDFTPSTKLGRANSKVSDYLGSLGFDYNDFKIAGNGKSDVKIFFVEFSDFTHGVYGRKVVPLTVAVLAPNGKLYFPITNEVVDLNETDRDAENLARVREAVQRSRLGGFGNTK